MIIDFDASPTANERTDNTINRRRDGGSSCARRYSSTLERKNAIESTSRRSVTHATDSARSG